MPNLLSSLSAISTEKVFCGSASDARSMMMEQPAASSASSSKTAQHGQMQMLVGGKKPETQSDSGSGSRVALKKMLERLDSVIDTQQRTQMPSATQMRSAAVFEGHYDPREQAQAQAQAPTAAPPPPPTPQLDQYHGAQFVGLEDREAIRDHHAAIEGLNNRIRQLEANEKAYVQHIGYLRSSNDENVGLINHQNEKIAEQDAKIAEQNAKIAELFALNEEKNKELTRLAGIVVQHFTTSM